MNLLSSWMLLQVWGHLAPLAIAEAPDTDPPPSLDPATPDTDPSPNPDPSPFPPPDLTPQVVAQSGPVMDTELIVIPVVPPIMGWLGSIGGVLGIISFTDTYLRKLFGLFKPRLPSAPPTPPEKHDAAWFTDFENRHRQVHNPKWPVRVAPKKEKDEEAPWKVGIQVGLDGSGLQVNASSLCSTLKVPPDHGSQYLKFSSPQRLKIDQHLTNFAVITRELGAIFLKSVCGTCMAS